MSAHNFIDLTGQRFGRLTVNKRAPKKYNSKQAFWECTCDCGKIVIVPGGELRSGHTKSCGCYKTDLIVQQGTSHGLSHSRIYSIWSDMKRRIFNSNHQYYRLYGGKGLSMDEKWVNDFQEFYNWSMDNGYSDDLTIDRIDNNKGYYPYNCRWTTTVVQANNTSRNHYIEINGETRTLAEWCKFYNRNYDMVRNRISLGWDKDRWFIPPTKTRKKGGF